MSGPIKKFNEMYWDRLLDKMIVSEGKELTAVFIGGYSVSGPANWKDKNGVTLKDRTDL